MIKKLYYVHVGVSGFPFGNAPINRCLAIYSLLSKSTSNVLLINNKSIHPSNIPINIERNGKYSDILYIYTTPTPYRQKNFFKRRYYNVIGRINEFFIITNLGLGKKIDIMFFYPKGSFFELIYYRFFSKILGFKLISHYVEFRSSFESRKKKWIRLNDYLFDNYFMFLIDGAIPISEFLVNQIMRKRKNLPYLKIPPVVNFKLFSEVNEIRGMKYFLYVGSTEYYSAIKIILDSFESVENKEYFLFLIIKGSRMNSILQEIGKHPKKNQIKVLSKLKYSELLEYYKSASALLIPLSDSLQDRARFPNKIAEYLASGNPLITTDFGEVKYYFKDMDNALVSKKNDSKNLSEKMNFVINNPEESKKIGINGFKTGLKYFDSNGYKFVLNNFVTDLIQS